MKPVVLCWLALAMAAQAQVPVTTGVPMVNELFDTPRQDSLRCSFHRGEPFLDFVFRYDAGYLVSTPLGQFAPGEMLVSYIRVKPLGGTPLLLREAFEVPQIPSDMAEKLDANKLKKIEIEMSSGFALGEGRYSVEAILLDQQGRSCRKQWSLETGKVKQSVPVALQPHTAAPFGGSIWDGKLAGREGLRLTVLLHATPMNPHMSKLYAWDRAFLLQSLGSLLRQMPVQSVRIVAFNLGQQREVFRQDKFDRSGFTRLTDVLRRYETATVSYKALQRQSWPEFLVHLTQEQTAAKDPSDVVVFLGPTSGFGERVPREMMPNVEGATPRFFYFEYYPWPGAEFPDTIDHLTHDLHGTVFRIHSADQLGQAIQKMVTKVKQPQSSAATQASLGSK